MTESKTTYVVVGKVGAPFGIKGWLKVASFSSQLLDYNPWYLAKDNNWQEVKVEDSREHGRGLIVKLAGLNNPEQARLLTGQSIAVKRSQLPVLAKNEYYWDDLQGLTVINQHGETLGTVSYLMETGANDVLVVKKEKEHAIPYLPEVIKQIDLDKRIIYVDWDLI
jgi:16S rRNA processing protein RimM